MYCRYTKRADLGPQTVSFEWRWIQCVLYSEVPLYVCSVCDILLEYYNNFYLVLQKRQDVVDFLYEATSFDMDKVMTTVKQFFWDWSREVWLVAWHCIILRRHPQGADERGRCYGPIIEELRREFTENRVWAFSGMVVSFSLLFPSDLSSVSVLVPGSRLGRLAYEIAHHGYTCQGNEFSMYMLLASHFILNKWDNFVTHPQTHLLIHSRHSLIHSLTYPLVHLLTHPLTHKLTHSSTHSPTHKFTHSLTHSSTHSPYLQEWRYWCSHWVLQTCNNWSNEHQLAAIQVPDVDPAYLPQYGLFSMAAGDFLEVYTEQLYFKIFPIFSFFSCFVNLFSQDKESAGIIHAEDIQGHAELYLQCCFQC